MWWWILFWAVLVLLALAYLAYRLWGLWGRAKEFGRELARAQERLDDVERRLESLGGGLTSVDQLGVFAGPVRAAHAQRETRHRTREQRRLRRVASAPGWAKHVD